MPFYPRKARKGLAVVASQRQDILYPHRFPLSRFAIVQDSLPPLVRTIYFELASTEKPTWSHGRVVYLTYYFGYSRISKLQDLWEEPPG